MKLNVSALIILLFSCSVLGITFDSHAIGSPQSYLAKKAAKGVMKRSCKGAKLKECAGKGLSALKKGAGALKKKVVKNGGINKPLKNTTRKISKKDKLTIRKSTKTDKPNTKYTAKKVTENQTLKSKALAKKSQTATPKKQNQIQQQQTQTTDSVNHLTDKSPQKITTLTGGIPAPKKRANNSIPSTEAANVNTTRNIGRQGRQKRLRELSINDKVSATDKGWIKHEINTIERGTRKTIRNPPGKDLAHERGRESAKGYGYQHSKLQDKSLHKLQHKYDNFGRKNKERPLKENNDK